MSSQPQFYLSTARLNEAGDTPLYRQIYDHFHKLIVSGKVEKNTILPSEQEITEKLGVSRITVRRALNELANSGLVTRQRGRGTIVTFNATVPTISAGFDQLMDGLRRMGVETEVRLISSTFITPGKQLREQMELQSQDKVQQIVRLRLLENEPFSYLVSYIPKHIAEAYAEEELASASLIGLLDRAGHQPRSAAQSINAVAASGDTAKYLEIAEGVPLLHIHRTMRDNTGQIVQDISAQYRADRFQYQMNLVRKSNEKWSESDQA